MQRVFGGNPITGYIFARSKSEPALLEAHSMGEALLFTGAGATVGLYGRFVRGYNNLWLLAAFAPLVSWGMVSKARQPTTLIDNSYR